MSKKKSGTDLDEYGFPFREYLEELETLEDFPAPNPKESSIPREIAGTFAERLKILKEAIEEIDSEIGIRKDLSKTFQQSLKISRDWLSKNLRRFENWQFGFKPSVDFRRTALERELLTVYREVRAEQQRSFSDIVGLNKEKRNLTMEYKSLKATGKMMSHDKGD